MTDHTTEPAPTAGAKMLFLIRRRSGATREELVAHWFANHMPLVIASQQAQAERGSVHAWRYIATLFDPDRSGEYPYDGIAALWFDRALPRPDVPFGTEPTDSFQQKAEPYLPWATTEYVIMDPADQLPVNPLTLNAPFPCTRSGFYKMSFLVRAKPDTDYEAFFEHWLGVHVPNVTSTMKRVGGFGYVVAHSRKPEDEPFAGMAELYFRDPAGWAGYRAEIEPDGMEAWVDPNGTVVLSSVTEMIGIP